MKPIHRGLVFAVVFSLAVPFAPVLAEHHEKPRGGMEMTSEMQKAFELSGPGPEHEFFKHFVGSWAYESKFWMLPGQPPMTTLGRSSSKMVLDGRFLQTEYTGEFMGMPFKGMGFDGYNRVDKKFVTVWMDNMSTMIMTMEGWLDDSGKTLTMKGQHTDPVTGETKNVKTVVTVVGKNGHKFEYYAPGPDGRPYLAMEMNYTRQ